MSMLETGNIRFSAYEGSDRGRTSTVPCGIDIGQTLIGMHIKHVCVPVRTSVKQESRTGNCNYCHI